MGSKLKDASGWWLVVIDGGRGGIPMRNQVIGTIEGWTYVEAEMLHWVLTGEHNGER